MLNPDKFAFNQQDFDNLGPKPQIPQYSTPEQAPMPSEGELIGKDYIESFEKAGLKPEPGKEIILLDLKKIHPEQKKFFNAAIALLQRFAKGEEFSAYKIIAEMRRVGLLQDVNTFVFSSKEMKITESEGQEEQGLVDYFKLIKDTANAESRYSHIPKAEMYHNNGFYSYNETDKRPFIALVDRAYSDEDSAEVGKTTFNLEQMIAFLRTLGHEFGHKIDDEQTGYTTRLLSAPLDRQRLEKCLETELRQMHFDIWFMENLAKHFEPAKPFVALNQEHQVVKRRLLKEHFKVESRMGIFPKIMRLFNR